MSWKKNLAFTAVMAGVTLGTLHVINRLFFYKQQRISCCLNMIMSIMSGGLERLRIRRKDQAPLYCLSIILMSAHLRMNGKMLKQNFPKRTRYIPLIS